MVSSPSRDLAIQLLLGAGLALGVATWFTAAGSFVTAKRVADEPRVAAALADLEDGAGLLRHQAGETNRLVFTFSGRAQVLLAGLAVGLAAWPPRPQRWVTALLAVSAILSSVLAFVIVPQALEHGASLALVPRPLPEELLPVKQAMESAHRLYSSLDLLRTALVLTAAVLLIRSARRAAPTAAVLTLLLVAPACSTGAPPAKPASSAPTARLAAGPELSPRAAAFDSGRAWRHLEAIVSMGPRLEGFPGHGRFLAHAREHFETLGWTVTEQPFAYSVPGESRVYQLRNLSAVLGPRDAKTILLGTHFDTRPWCDEESDPGLRRRPVPGANDGGSGVAVLMELARVLSEDPPDHGVEILLFDGEDLGRPGHPEEYSQGAQHLVREWATITEGAPFPAAVVVIDMVGDSDLEFHPEAASMQAAPDLTRRIWRAAKRIGHGKLFRDSRPRGIWDDHRPFLQAGVPAALMIDLDYPHWHTVRDTIDKCSPDSLEIAGRVVLEAMFFP
jgi:hypothetical protein